MTSQDMEELKEIWNEISKCYEDMNMIITTRMIFSFIDIPDYSSIDKILETGCGPGNAIDKILSRAKPTAELICTDIAESMIAKASAKNYPRTTLLFADNQSLPFADEEFDLYLSNMCLMLVPDPMKALIEACRVTKPGSLSIFSLIGIEGNTSFHDVLTEAFAEVNFHPQMRSFTHFSDHNKLRSMAKEAGFSRVFTYDSSIPISSFDIDFIMKAYEMYPHLAEIKNTEKHDEILRIAREKVTAILNSGQILECGFIVCLAVK